VVVATCGLIYVGDRRRIMVQAGLGKNGRPYLKNNLKQKELEVWLKWQSKALSSNPSTTKKKSMQSTNIDPGTPRPRDLPVRNPLVS
jgi:hypothetical protein